MISFSRPCHFFHRASSLSAAIDWLFCNRVVDCDVVQNYRGNGGVSNGAVFVGVNRVVR